MSLDYAVTLSSGVSRVRALSMVSLVAKQQADSRRVARKHAKAMNCRVMDPRIH